MHKVLIIGAGGVGAVGARKCAGMPEVFGEIMPASRTAEDGLRGYTCFAR
ncbi:MAG: hypothetical protein LBP38_07060 [Desulfovibrio sp.]|jgi:saccharopine dehydrogenase (NAD+, L-lysine-forming)|nr:hypothetical protein [Desulfovibrio sp.]